jgi:hypothetical protein
MMLRGVDQVSGLARLDVFGTDDCRRIADDVLAMRNSWIVRSPSSAFFTSGVNAYMDLARTTDPQLSYDNPAKNHNQLLRARFGDVLEELAATLAQALGRRVRLTDDLALPGFHIWTGAAVPRGDDASVHFDLQYQRILARPAYAAASGTLSFTVPTKLPEDKDGKDEKEGKEGAKEGKEFKEEGDKENDEDHKDDKDQKEFKEEEGKEFKDVKDEGVKDVKDDKDSKEDEAKDELDIKDDKDGKDDKDDKDSVKEDNKETKDEKEPVFEAPFESKADPGPVSPVRPVM